MRTILVFMVVGLGTGFAVGAQDGNLAIRSSAATSWMILLGAVSGFGCVIRNRPSIWQPSCLVPIGHFAIAFASLDESQELAQE